MWISCQSSYSGVDSCGGQGEDRGLDVLLALLPLRVLAGQPLGPLSPRLQEVLTLLSSVQAGSTFAQ